MRNAFADEVTNLAAEDSRIVLLSGDIGNRLFDKLRETTPQQFLNCGIAEGNMMSVAAGMGLCGLRPIVYTIAPFVTTRCLEQIRVDVAYHNSPVIIVGTGSGLSYASLGPTHHSLEDFAILRAIPNMQILAPWDAPSLRDSLTQAIKSNIPTYIRIGKKGEKDITTKSEVPHIGSGVTIKEGSDFCIIATGTIAHEAIKISDKLTHWGHNSELILLHTIKPTPSVFIESVIEKHKFLFILEEHSMIGGLGESCEVLNSRNSKACKVKIFGTFDQFLHNVGSQNYAQNYFGINSEKIAQEINNILKNENRF
jgi:transketolase